MAVENYNDQMCIRDSYYTALSSGSEWAFDLGVNMGESFIVSGSGTKSGNLYNGSAAISYNGNELFGLDIVNADGKSGDGTYTVYIKDGLANLVSGIDSATLTIIKTAKIEFTKTTEMCIRDRVIIFGKTVS